jgi:hypothetical protein
MKFIKAETETKVLNPPHDGCYPNGQADNVYKRIEFVFPEVSYYSYAIVPEHMINGS